MPVLTYFHQLFHADTCYAYIRTCGGKIARLTVPVVIATESRSILRIKSLNSVKHRQHRSLNRGNPTTHLAPSI
jgi:hypothetical protein